MQDVSFSLKSGRKTIGFVPTMGFLHEGHLSLVKRSKELCDVTIVSIFVNPTQFSPSEDLALYPRDIEKDSKLLLKLNVDYLFNPNADEIYPQNFQTFVDVNYISKKHEGDSRPTHFKGVTTVVNILFNCIMPDHAFFGQKDAQQAAVIKQMVNDLKIPVNIVVCPVVREKDGLAMSTRNVYLSADERKDALAIYNAIQKAKKMIKKGERKVSLIISEMMSIIEKVKSTDLDYIEIVEIKSFEAVDELKSRNEYYILVACKFGNTRLIDNELIKVD
jgi:pantoate--beta-alanine ligase